MKRLLPLLSLLVAAGASAQLVTIGSVAGVETTSNLSATTIDMSNPANAAGQVTNIFVRWSGAGSSCSATMKFKIVRLDVVSGVFNVVADRGPFAVVNGANKIALAPPVDVAAGDLVATVTSGTCGGVAAAHAGYGDFSLVTSGDFPSGRAISSFNLNRETRPLVQLTNSDAVLSGVIPAVGAAQGGFGSFFRTSMQIANPTSTTSSVRIVFHPMFASAQANDPAKSFTLPPLTATTHTDIVTEMGLSGLGSMDVTTTNGVPPVVTTRVYNDAGDAGTTGFYEDAVLPTDAMHASDTATFTLPADPANFRVNVGVRSLAPAQFSITYYEPNGGAAQGGTIFKSYPANYFEQVPVTSFLNTSNVIPGGLVVIRMIGGDAIIYFSTTDNRTNDTSATVLKPQR